MRGMRNENCEGPSPQPVGLPRPQIFETHKYKPSASVTIIVSFFSVVADRLEAASGTPVVVLRTRLHVSVNEIYHVGIEFVKIDISLISVLVYVAGADHLAIG